MVFAAIAENTSKPTTNDMAEAIFALLLKKYIKKIQLEVPRIGTTGYSGTLNKRIVFGSDLRSFRREINEEVGEQTSEIHDRSNGIYVVVERPRKQNDD